MIHFNLIISFLGFSIKLLYIALKVFTQSCTSGITPLPKKPGRKIAKNFLIAYGMNQERTFPFGTQMVLKMFKRM